MFCSSSSYFILRSWLQIWKRITLTRIAPKQSYRFIAIYFNDIVNSCLFDCALNRVIRTIYCTLKPLQYDGTTNTIAWNAFRFLDWVFNPFHECPSILERSKFGKILFKDKLPYDTKIPMKFLYVSVLSLLHSSYISSWCYLQNHIGFKLIWDVST